MKKIPCYLVAKKNIFAIEREDYFAHQSTLPKITSGHFPVFCMRSTSDVRLDGFSD